VLSSQQSGGSTGEIARHPQCNGGGPRGEDDGGQETALIALAEDGVQAAEEPQQYDGSQVDEQLGYQDPGVVVLVVLGDLRPCSRSGRANCPTDDPGGEHHHEQAARVAGHLVLSTIHYYLRFSGALWRTVRIRRFER
jgi:hypothetical protein